MEVGGGSGQKLGGWSVVGGMEGQVRRDVWLEG